jgi:hypothetical protein
VRDLPRWRHRKIAAVGVQIAAQHGEQRGFARAVSTDEPRLFARIERERSLFEKRFGAAGKTELVEANHGVRTQASTGKRYFRLSPPCAARSLPLSRRWPFGRMFFGSVSLRLDFFKRSIE